MAAVVTLGLMFCCATVSLEAVGLLFKIGVPDPQQRIEAFVARLEADLSPVDLPTEPVEVVQEVAQTLPGSDAVHATAAETAPDADGAGNAAEVADEVPPEGLGLPRLAVAMPGPMPPSPPESMTQAEEAVVPEETVAPEEAAAPGHSEPRQVAAAPLSAVEAPDPVSALAQSVPRAGAARRMRPVLRPVGYAAFGWPVLDWLTL